MNIDSHQVFPELDINKIDDTICKSDNPKTGLFLLENKHLINKYYLNTNKNEWAIKFIDENPEYKFDYNTEYNIISFKLDMQLFGSFLHGSAGLKYSN